jgi:hypothetical protein
MSSPRLLERQGLGAVLLTWALLALVTNAPYVRAALDPPAGRAFAGTFHWVDDFYNYVSFVQQAEEGRFLFRNKLLLEPHKPSLVNLEWWLVGRVSAALGGRPFLAYRLLGLLASLALLLGVERWLRRGGLPPSHTFPALFLVGTGGGLGGLLFLYSERGVDRCLDLSVGLYPFLGLLANPHWVLAWALLLWALLEYQAAAGDRWGWLRATLLASALGLVRPYDLVLLVVIHLVSVLIQHPRDALRRLLPLAGLIPVGLYNYWVFFESAAFSSYARLPYLFPATGDVVLALAPAALAPAALAAAAALPAAVELRRGGGGEPAAWTPLLAWVGIGAAVVVLQPVQFSLQFLVGIGLPLLALAALALVRRPPAATWLATVALCTSSLVALQITLQPNPHWFPPRAQIDVARALGGSCQPGDRLLAPPQIGLFAAGLSACTPFVAHPAMLGHHQRLDELRRFYAAPPERRRAMLARLQISFLVLPGDAGPVAAGWLGADAGFRRLERVGAGPGSLSLYARDGTP